MVGVQVFRLFLVYLVAIWESSISFCWVSKIQEKLSVVSKQPMDPSQKFNPTLVPESSKMLTEENSQDDSGASQNFCSETLIKNLSNLTINPSTKFSSLLPEGSPQQQYTGAMILREIRDDLLYRRFKNTAAYAERKDGKIEIPVTRQSS